MRASRILRSGTWNEAAARDSVLLDHDRRHRRRVALKTEGGKEILLDLPQAARLRDGDGLALESGEIIRVRARPEAVLEIRAPDASTLLRIAWHLGNRHLPVQVVGDRLRILADHVIAEMIARLGGRPEAGEAPFDPEPGAYEAGQHEPHAHDGH